MLGLGRALLLPTASVVRTSRQRGIGLLHQQIHAAILGGSHHKLTLLLPTEREKRKHIAVAIAHVDPLHSRWRGSDGLHTAFPYLRLARALLALPPRFSLGSRVSQERFLLHQTQHLPTLGHHRQHALQQVAMMGPIADRSQSRRRGMLLVVHFRRILDQQHLPLLPRLRARLLHMRAHQLLIGHPRRLQEAIGRLQGRFLLHLRRQGGGRIMGDGRRHDDGSLAPALVAQAHASKGFLGPFLGRQQGARIHQLPSFCSFHHSLMNSITSLLHFCDKQSGGRPLTGPIRLALSFASRVTQ